MHRGHPRILIVRLSAIGDTIHTMPVLCALRDQLPNAFLGWVVERRSSELLRDHPALDELIVLPRRWFLSPRVVWDLRRRLKKLRFDVAVDVQGLTKSAVTAWLSGARRRIGMAGIDGRELSPWLNNERVEPRAAHIVDRNLELLRPLGIEAPMVRFGLPRLPLVDDRAEQIIADAHLGNGFAVINPGAGWSSKLWPPERFAALARHLGHNRGLASIVVSGGAEEHAWARAIVAGSEDHARLAPATSLVELAALVRRARLFIASDTGPLHVAAAVGTPCVGLFGPMPADRNGPYGSAHATVQRMQLSGSSRSRRNAGPESMLAIKVEDVARACDQILASRSKAA
jgi:lipopolysaccharide heptosyltransferase I